MANEFPKLSEVFKIGTEVTYDEAIEKVFLPQDNAVKSIPTISPIETVTLTGNKIVPTAFLVQVKTVEELSNELHFIDYTNLRDGATLQLRILDNNNPIVIKNGISGVGSIMTADGNDIELNDYRTIVQLQLEDTLWRQVGGIQAQADWNQVDSKKPDFIKNKPTNLLDSTRITNCITEIPQDIKLELKDGVLTLKAGSKVYVPNGFEDGLLKFDEVVISSDLTTSIADNNKHFIFYNLSTNGLWFSSITATRSGATNPSDLWGFFYNSTDNKVYYLRNSTTPDNLTFSLPVATVISDGTQITSIDQVFNGFGYIGGTVFALPGVKGLIPDGRNEDGTLKNDIFSVTNVIPITINSGPNGIKSIYFTTFGGIGITSSYTYDLQKNILLDTEDNSIIDGCIAINFVWDNSQQAGQKITAFNPKLPFRAADDQETVHKTGDEEIGGVKTFNDTTYFAKNGSNIVLSGGEGGKELGEILFSGNNDYPNGTHLDRYENCLRIFGEHDQTKTHAVLTTLSINKSSNAIGLKLGNGIIINSLILNSQGTTYTWKIPFTTTEYVVVTTSCSGLKNFTRTTTTISCNDFHHGETSKPSDVMAIAIGY